MQVRPEQILPSQGFLKEKTIRFILECFRTGHIDELPPTPLVRHDEEGNLVAIDGHNLIAVRLHRNEPIDVIVATSPEDGLPETSEANAARNRDLAEKYDTVLAEQRCVAAEGIASFADLITKYPDLLGEAS
jgi:hypothetical protein